MDSDRSTREPGVNALGSEEISRRKHWLTFTAKDDELIAEIDQDLGDYSQDLVDGMYEHFFSFAETSAFFSDPEVFKRARTAQIKYFQRLTKGNYDENYVKERLQVGYAHYRIDLDPKWYMGAYSFVMTRMLGQLRRLYGEDPDKLCAAIAALQKVIFLDMGLAIESYIAAKEQALRVHQDTIRELETEKRVTKSILENAPVGIVNLDQNFRCLDCNDQFLAMLGAGDNDKIVGELLFDVAPFIPCDPFAEVVRTGQPFIASGRPVNLSRSQAADRRFWDLAIWPIKTEGGSVMGIVAQFADVSDRLLLQQQREDFVATLTHDLKTPILAANRAVKLLIEGDFGPIASQQAEILETIHQSNEALYTLVRTLLDVYRYDSGAKQLLLKPHDLRATIIKVVSGLKPLAESKQIEFVTILPSSAADVICDEEEIRRVVQNLVDNSLKFTQAGGSITLQMSQEKDVSLISVQDTGKGVSSEEQAKLFQRFWQASSSGRYYASTGLGLYLCRKIVELHGGQIWCKSTPGMGSTFSFTIGTAAG